MIELEDCLRAISIEQSALNVLNKLIFSPKKAYVVSSDNQTYYDFGCRLSSKLPNIIKSIKDNIYKFKPCRKIVRRTKTRERDIYLSCWDDKIVETWLNDSLNRVLSSWFSPCAYAYRVGSFGLDSCQNKIKKVITTNQYFAKRDISKYFYTINQEMLLDKLRELINPEDFLYNLIKQRIKFEYVWKDQTYSSNIGIAFGSPLACTLSNIYLTDLDRKMMTKKVAYFRYADDILIAGRYPNDVIEATNTFDTEILNLKLSLKPSHTRMMSFICCPGFEQVSKFSHLGLEYLANKQVKFAVEKQRKIINFFKRELNRRTPQIKKMPDLNEKIKYAIAGINEMVSNRIRSAAIVDYYLKHVDFEPQLRNMDRIIIELVIGVVLNKKFKISDFRIISPGELRKLGLISLLHRNRLHRHGYLKVNFLSMHNELVLKRYLNILDKRRARINHLKISNKIRRSQKSLIR